MFDSSNLHRHSYFVCKNNINFFKSKEKQIFIKQAFSGNKCLSYWHFKSYEIIFILQQEKTCILPLHAIIVVNKILHLIIITHKTVCGNMRDRKVTAVTKERLINSSIYRICSCKEQIRLHIIKTSFDTCIVSLSHVVCMKYDKLDYTGNSKDKR